MSVLLHVSDTHFGTERPAVVDALVRWIAEQSADLVILSGDITQRARRAQFDAARRFVQRLSTPVLAIPGNHDLPLFNLWQRLFKPYRGYRRVFGDELEPQWESSDWLVIGVNTTRRQRHTNGEISPAQIRRVAQQLRSARPGQRRVVVTHQPMLVTRPEDQANLLHGHARAAQAWVEAGADLLLGGHIHLPYIRPMTEAHPGLPREAWVVQAGTAVSHRVRGGIPNSVNRLAHGERDYCELQRWDYAHERGAFVLERSKLLQLSA